MERQLCGNIAIMVSFLFSGKRAVWGLALPLVMLAAWGGTAVAQCTTTGSVTICTGTVNNAASIGDGSATYDNYTVTIGDGSTRTLVTQNGSTVISLHDNDTITIKNNAIVQGNTSANGGGHYNSGPNVIEFNSKTTVTIEAGATVQQLGTTTNGEAINAHGYGNSITNNGTLYSANGAALWFQDTTTSNDSNDRNEVINYGTISTGKGAGYNVFGSSRGSGGPGLVFKNYGTVDGSLAFGNGDDSLTFGTGSVITGNVNGGGGKNDLTLDTSAGESATLGGSVANFTTITKTGAGGWAILGQVPQVEGDPNAPDSPITGALENINALIVQQGLLNIVGAAPKFAGTVQIDAVGALIIQAQSINNAASMLNNGQLVFDQPFDDTYTGKAIIGSGLVIKQGSGSLTMSSSGANTYSGGTQIAEGALIVDQDSDLGASTGALIFGSNTISGYSTMGTLTFDSSFNLAITRAISIRDGGGTINTNGNNTTITQVIDGTGMLYKDGAGTLYLTGSNNYAGGTTVEAGVLNINSDSALGASGTQLVMYDQATLQANASGSDITSGRGVTLAGAPGNTTVYIDTNGKNITLTGTVGGQGALDKQGAGTLYLTGNNTYAGGTIVEAGVLNINSDNALGSSGTYLVLFDQTTLQANAAGGDISSSRTITLAGQPGVAVTYIDTNTRNITLTGTVDGGGALVKQGQGVLALYGANNYQGGTWVETGPLAINSNNALGIETGGLELYNQTTLRLDGNVQMTVRPIVIGNTALDATTPVAVTVDTNGFNGEFDESISEAAAGTRLDKTGAGVLALYGDNSYSGGTWVKEGAVAIKGVTGTGTGDIYLGNTTLIRATGDFMGTLRLDADVDYTTSTTPAAIYLNLGGAAIEVTGSYTGTLRENMLQDGSADPNGVGRGAGDLHKTGTGVLLVVGDQPYTGGTYVDAGIFRLDAVNPANPMVSTVGLINTSSMNVAAGARLEGQGLVGKSSALTTNSGTIAPGLSRFTEVFDNTIRPILL